MSSISISDLAPELLCLLFLSCDSLCDVSHLASASKIFREIFKSNAHSIYYAVAPRHTRLFDEAQALLDAQDLKAISQGEEVSSNANDAAALRLMRLGFNERSMLTFSSSFVTDCIQFASIARTRKPPLVTESEIARFQHAYYRLWALMESLSTNICELVAGMTFRELICLDEVQTWVIARFYKHNTRQQLFSYKKWNQLSEILIYTVQEKYSMNPALVLGRGPSTPASAPWIPWTIWDQYQMDYITPIPDIL
ncbi:hypothetical protein MMC18_002961 [Xylographa bjoerkii]|nr:hypothetical protein [Xylographa bjoerkii]